MSKTTLSFSGILLYSILKAMPVSAAFSYLTCPTGTYTYVPVNIGTWDYERKAGNGSWYANYGEYGSYLYFSGNVALFWPRMKDFHVETNFDYLEVQAGAFTVKLTGDYTDGYTGGSYVVDSQASSAHVRWHSDLNVARQSTPRFDEVRVSCNAGNAALRSHGFGTNSRVDGVLLGGGDVQYFVVLQPSNTVLDITLDMLAASPITSDFDVYASFSTQFPDDSAFDYRAYHGNTTGTIDGGGEDLFIPSSTANRFVYIGVRSYAGKGQFALHANAVKSAVYVSDAMQVCTTDTFDASHPNWANYARTLRKISARATQMTNGGRIPHGWYDRVITCDLVQFPYCAGVGGCNAVMQSSSIPCVCSSQTAILGPGGSESRFKLPNISCSSCYDGTSTNPDSLSIIVAHEWGHAKLGLPDGLPDEYEAINPTDFGPFCGHSIMNGPDLSHTLCTALNHCKDPAWSTASGRYYQPPSGFDCSISNGPMWQRVWAGGTVISAAVPPSTTMADQWDSLRRNENWLSQIQVTP